MIMCSRLFVVNQLFLGSRELGFELFNDKEVVEMTAIQLRNTIKAGKDVRGVVIDKATNELVLDKDGFYSVNMMKHSHINNYEPMIESDSKVNVFYIVMDKHTENDKSVYDLLSSRFERVTVSEDKLITYLELGLVSAGAKLENGKVLLPVKESKTDQEKKELPVKEEPTVVPKVEAPATVEKPVAVKAETAVKEEKPVAVKASGKDKK